MGYGGKRVPDDERYVGDCEWCSKPMFMPPHGWSQIRRQPRRWCSRECRTAGNRAEARARAPEQLLEVLERHSEQLADLERRA